MKHSPESPPVTTGPVVIVVSHATTAEMLHTFFRLMELDAVILSPAAVSAAEGITGLAARSADHICRLVPAAVVIDLEAPDLPALELARELRHRHPALPIVLLTDRRWPPPGFAAARIPHGNFEELLAVMEALLG
jgi:DNA-binding NarL/FixJ family response regulator